MTDFDAWLAAPPPEPTGMAARFPDSKRVGTSKTNPYSSRDNPYLELTEAEYFKVLDVESEDGTGKCQIREVIAFEREDLGEWRREYRGYGVRYLKDGRTFAKRGAAQFILLEPGVSLPAPIKERLDAQPWPPHPA